MGDDWTLKGKMKLGIVKICDDGVIRNSSNSQQIRAESYLELLKSRNKIREGIKEYRYWQRVCKDYPITKE